MTSNNEETQNTEQAQQFHPLAQTWHYYAIRFGVNYTPTKIEIPINDVETFWEITNEFPEFSKIYQSAIGLFKDPFESHYDNDPVFDFSLNAKGRDTLIFQKILCAVIGGHIDKETQNFGEFRGIYITLKSEDPRYCFWFTPEESLLDHVEDIKQALRTVLERCGLTEFSIQSRRRP